jgi:peroxiredoxin Q/BCP
MALPEIGSVPAPFTLPNQDGKSVSLADYAGRHVLVWFYPRAFGNN